MGWGIRLSSSQPSSSGLRRTWQKLQLPSSFSHCSPLRQAPEISWSRRLLPFLLWKLLVRFGA